MLLGEVRRTDALRLVARRAREVAEAELVLVLLYDEDTGQLTVEVVDARRRRAGRPGRRRACRSPSTALADAVAGSGHVVLEDLGKAAAWPVPVQHRRRPWSPRWPPPTRLQGVLVVAHAAGRGRATRRTTCRC